MDCRQRILKTIRFENPDYIPINYSAQPAALLKHGRPLIDLMCKYPSDYYDPAKLYKLPQRDTANYRPDGSYYRQDVDQWGCKWVYYKEGLMALVA